MLTLALQYPVTMAPYPYLTLTLALTNQARDCSRASARAYLFVGPRLSPSSVEFSRGERWLAPRLATVASCSLGAYISPAHTPGHSAHIFVFMCRRVRDFDHKKMGL